MIQEGDSVGYCNIGMQLVKMMEKHCVDKLDVFETSLSVAKALSLLLESPDKEAIMDVPLESTLEFFNHFIEKTKA